MKSKATIKDVAKLAKVSIKTVSRVTNAEGSVGEKTLEKVTAAIKELNYQPNLAARNLAGTQSYSLGFVYDNPNAYYIIDMQNGILEGCNARGYELVIRPCSSSNKDIVEELVMMVKRSQLAGLIICPPLSESPSIMDALAKRDVKFVRVVSSDGQDLGDTPCVYVNDQQAAFSITNHLASLGHKKIGFLRGDADHRSSLERERGYCNALENNQLAKHDEYQINGSYSFEFGVQGAKQLLALPNPPSAIFACNDEIAAGALFAARLEGIQVPSQLAIAGFEDSPFSRQTLPKLTTAAQPNYEIAKQATALLIEHIERYKKNRSVDKEIKHLSFEPKLVVRHSTDLSAEDMLP
ncbi:MAG: LacI family DNA-binding transcriptional regulator [Glaciecola sp.]